MNLPAALLLALLPYQAPTRAPHLELDATLRLSGSSVTALTVSPDGEHMAAGLANGLLHLFAPGGEDGGLEIDLGPGALIRLQFDARGERLVVASSARSAFLLDRDEDGWIVAGEFLGGTRWDLTAVALSEATGLVAAGDHGGRIYLGCEGRLRRIPNLTMRQDVVHLEFVDGGDLVAIGRKGRYLRLDPRSGKIVSERKLVTNPIRRTPDVFDVSRRDGDVVLSTLFRTTSVLAPFSGATAPGVGPVNLKLTAYVATIDPETGETLGWVASGTGILEIYRVVPGADLAVALFSRHRDLAHTFSSPVLSLWDSREGVQLQSLRHVTPILSLAVDPLGRWVAVGGVDGTVSLYKIDL